MFSFYETRTLEQNPLQWKKFLYINFSVGQIFWGAEVLTTFESQKPVNKTITEEYRKLQQELHKNPNYGVASLKIAPLVADLINQVNVISNSDYGAGKKFVKGFSRMPC